MLRMRCWRRPWTWGTTTRSARSRRPSSKRKVAMKTYVASFKGLRTKVKAKAAVEAAKKRKVPGAAKAKAKSGAASKLPSYSIHDLLPEAAAKQYMPQGMGFGKDLRNSRWWYREEPFSISRSFVKYGEVIAFALDCEASYTWLDQENPHKWITNVALASTNA